VMTEHITPGKEASMMEQMCCAVSSSGSPSAIIRRISFWIRSNASPARFPNSSATKIVVADERLVTQYAKSRINYGGESDFIWLCTGKL
jgi:hypothetical protein